MNLKINKKIKLSVILMLSTLTLFGSFTVPVLASATTCNSATLNGNVFMAGAPVRARFKYSANYNTVANGQGIPTATQTFYADGPMEQFISGLTQNTTYYFRLEVTNNYGAQNSSITNFKTPECVQIPTPTVTCQNTNAINYSGLLPCMFQVINQPSNQQPTVVLYADKETVPVNGSATIRWIANNATSCSGYSGSFGWAGLKTPTSSGSFFVESLTSDQTYEITCVNNVGSAADSVKVAIREPIPKTANVKPTPEPKVSAQIIGAPVNETIAQPVTAILGANAFRAGFFPTNLFEWLFLLILIIILILLAKHILNQSFRKKNTAASVIKNS